MNGSPLPMVTSSGASEVPSAYGLGGSSTRTVPRRSAIRRAFSAAAAMAASGRPAAGRRHRPQQASDQRVEHGVRAQPDAGVGHRGRPQVVDVGPGGAHRVGHRADHLAAAGAQRVAHRPGLGGRRRAGRQHVVERARGEEAGLQQGVDGLQQRGRPRRPRRPTGAAARARPARRCGPVRSGPGRPAPRSRPGWTAGCWCRPGVLAATAPPAAAPTRLGWRGAGRGQRSAAGR